MKRIYCTLHLVAHFEFRFSLAVYLVWSTICMYVAKLFNRPRTLNIHRKTPGRLDVLKRATLKKYIDTDHNDPLDIIVEIIPLNIILRNYL